MYKQRLKLSNDRLDRELKTLYELGVPEGDILYLKHLKNKQDASGKWR